MTLSNGALLLNIYRIESPLGEGSFGEVYRVTHLKLGVTRAIKILRADAPGLGSQGFADARARFHLEAHLGAQLNTTAHPHLIPVYAVEEDQGMLLLEMEYEPGGSLADRLAQYKRENRLMPVDEALRITQDLAAGLAVVHQHDIVHRDLKPSNILFDAQGRAKIADLGLAQIPGGMSMRSQLSQPASHPGTPVYMSPEQQKGGRYLSPASDIYSVGVILFEMLTGRVYKNLLPGTRIKTLRPDVPNWVDTLLVKTLANDPKDRPWNGQVLGSRLQTPEINSKLPIVMGGVSMLGLSTVGIILLGIIIFLNMQNNTSKIPGATATITLTPALLDVGTDSVNLAIATETDSPSSTKTSIPEMSENLDVQISTATETPPPQFTQTSTPTSKPALPGLGSSQVLSDGMTLLFVPEGEFIMGSNDSSYPDEKPAHTVYLDAFWIDETEVTNNMFTAFTNATGYVTELEKQGMIWLYESSLWYEVTGNGWRTPFGSQSNLSDRGNYPVIQVTWNDAQAYCKWAGRRLPTEAEWEKAARGTADTTYPWGNASPSKSLANYDNQVGDLVAVGSYPGNASPYGALDMAGNVYEWVVDWYEKNYYTNSPSSNPNGPASGSKKVLRGGSWQLEERRLYTYEREVSSPDISNSNIGFRCALSAPLP